MPSIPAIHIKPKQKELQSPSHAIEPIPNSVPYAFFFFRTNFVLSTLTGSAFGAVLTFPVSARDSWLWSSFFRFRIKPLSIRLFASEVRKAGSPAVVFLPSTCLPTPSWSAREAISSTQALVLAMETSSLSKS